MNRFKWGLAAMLSLLLVVLAGCQAVGGVDVSKAALSTLDVKSSISKQTLSLQLVPADGKLSEEDKKVIDLFNSLSVTIDQAIMQDMNHVSLEGAVQIQGKKLPFHLAMDKKALNLSVEGMTQPISVPLDMEELNAAFAVQQMNNESLIQMYKNVLGFMLKHTPNPSNISVTPVTDKVNGESLSLQKLHIEIRGDELAGLAKGFLISLSKDEEGLKELISSLYDTYYPLITAYAGVPQEDEVQPTAAEREKEINAAVKELMVVVNELLPEFDKNVNGLFEGAPELRTILGKDTVLSLDLLLDSKLNIRKQNMDLTIQLPANEEIPVKQVKVHSESETWKVNEPVTIHAVDSSKGFWNVVTGEGTPGDVLRHMDSKSDLYRFVKDDIEITRKSIIMHTGEDPTDLYGAGYKPVIVNNTLMVPLKYVADQLDAKLSWDNATKQITLTEDLTGAKIVLKMGSKHASINSEAEVLAEPVQNFEGYAYVPMRFIAKALGAQGQWDAKEKILTIKRD
ncbi:copper amine oxidase N-terminal domain-containing protein [Paenibacillus sp. N3/727]|uniref:copper amine oxidase N-terminal domain-containing protein n=1 Tax=Paenibacillus sp. N3/727 TaxID=2925845 RepID=UPI001F52F5AA|nr:copper amine oxidase N-terminal domain-containing protein [Paenibacillus sp. N3/727]UNK20700.1 copper amine oxidase N-terminal domain-containing protein [Paenibacillus sp. N3/727]